MLRVTIKNVCGRAYIAVHCQAHGLEYPHILWARGVEVGSEDGGKELEALCNALEQCRRSWERGDWEFTDDCYATSADDPAVSRPWL
jgi:hypothetical protein